MKNEYSFTNGKRAAVLRPAPVGSKHEPLETTLRRVLREELPKELKRAAGR